MGLNAFVRCNCYADGLCSEPPVPREWLIRDTEGALQLAPEHDTDKHSIDFNLWLRNACRHKNMFLVWEWISNWTGVRSFQQALAASGGAETFPILSSTLPEINGGELTSAQAALGLTELARFQQTDSAGTNTFLVDCQTGDEIWEYIHRYGGIVVYGGGAGVNLGISPEEFFIRDRTTGLDRFRARSFEQRLLATGQFEYHNLETGEKTAIDLPLGGAGKENVRCFRVQQRPIAPSRFADICQRLTRVFQASVASRNPVIWT